MKFIKKMLFGAALGGAAYLLFSEKGKKIREEVAQRLPELLRDAQTRISRNTHEVKQVIREVVDEYVKARKLMVESGPAMKNELRKKLRSLTKKW